MCYFFDFNLRRTGPFKVFNEKDEEAVLRKFVSHVQELRPHVVVTYNGDKFDWPYVETRCKKYSYLNLYTSLGIRSTAQPGGGGGGFGGGAGGGAGNGNNSGEHRYQLLSCYLSEPCAMFIIAGRCALFLHPPKDLLLFLHFTCGIVT